MATVQNLEKLTRLLTALESDSSLEAAVATERLNALILTTQQLMRQRAFLREERRRIRITAERNESLKTSLEKTRKLDWINSRVSLMSDGEVTRVKDSSRVKVNVGGLVFDVNSDILKRDPTSLLASLDVTSPDTSLVLPEDGIFYFDRDWWLFRYILRFLRDGFLPDDRTLLGHLYKEAGFWHLLELRKAIEEEKLHLREDKLKPQADEDKLMWWKEQPKWWAESVQESKVFSSQLSALTAVQNIKPEFHAISSSSTSVQSKKDDDWWTATTYKGRSFAT